MKAISNHKFKKIHRPSIFIKGQKAKKLSYFKTGFLTTRNCDFQYNRVEAVRKSITRIIKPKRKKKRKQNPNIVIKKVQRKKKKRKKRRSSGFIFKFGLTRPVTQKSSGIRMGKGCGAIAGYAHLVPANSLLMEFKKKRLKKFFKVFKAAKKKMSLKYVYAKTSRRERFEKSQGSNNKRHVFSFNISSIFSNG